MSCTATTGELLFSEVLGPLNGDPNAITLVFLHGIAGSTAAWGDTFRSLAAKHRVVLLDCLGFGNSPKPKVAYTVKQHLDALSTTLLNLHAIHGLQQLVLVGHSMGAILAAHWAVEWKEPFHLKSVVLLSLPVYESAQQASRQVAASSLFNKWMALETPAARTVCWLMCRLRPALMPLMPYFLNDLPPAVARDSLKHTWWSYSGSLREVVLGSRAAALIQTLHQRGCAFGFVHGVGDVLAPIENLLQAIQTLQPATSHELLQLEGGHDIVFKHAPACVQFISKMACQA
ncbi:MAG: alpha/beta fold hydrolase [Burkholderiales bacterium]|jgi:pimeloyl-ACP methyl ester carboxylesterase|nr:alpha/beta fold hydrolase [Burkholderiales bacterium]